MVSGCSGVYRVLTMKSVKMGPLKTHMGVVGHSFELAAVQLDVYEIAEVLWKIIAFKREILFRLIYRVQQSLEFCEGAKNCLGGMGSSLERAVKVPLLACG